MATRNLHDAVNRIREWSLTDPDPNRRAAFEEVLRLLGGVDTLDLDAFVAATAPRPLPCRQPRTDR